MELFAAIQGQDLARARRVNERIYPVIQAFYAPPILDMHNRMKTCLQLLGRLDSPVVRPPLARLDDAEVAGLRVALIRAGMLSAVPKVAAIK